ncbi:type II secretion system protein [Marinobacter sp. HL-58]|uniref:type IV pilus modification PilV family protein n=1 Tax=Marinobacter sp. HL-58 TaxID=1479237 RepID=UPI0004836103|nr:type II secretion system protein [Marinobacter sp. HL-58]KPQ01957.1 MAG: T2bSS MSH-type system minor pilin protein MshD [Marinobacter sp. HL-58]
MRSIQGGATLVELVMTIVIISVAIAGVVGAFALISGRSADPLNQTRAVELAQLYMDEIISKKYDDATPQGGTPKYAGSCNIGPEEESRDTYNDVDDYDGTSDSPPRSAEAPLDGYDGFTVDVAVACAGGEVDLPGPEAKRIDLIITTPGGQSFSFSAYRANF